MKFSCCVDEDPSRKVQAEEVDAVAVASDKAEEVVGNPTPALQVDHVSISVNSEDTDAHPDQAPKESPEPLEQIKEEAEQIQEEEDKGETLQQQQLNEARQAMASLGVGMQDYMNSRGMAKELADDGIYKGVSREVLSKNFGGIWKGVIGDFQDASELASNHTADLPLAGFLSHSWRSSWWKKHLMLSLHWYMIPVGAASLLLSGAAMYPLGMKGVLVYYIIFPLLLWIAPSLNRIFEQVTGKSKSLYFLDKCCISQSPHSLKLKGIFSLDKYLGTSQQLIVLFDENYFTRTWCMYEIATYLYILRSMRGKRRRASWIQNVTSKFGDDKKFRVGNGLKMVPISAAPYFVFSFVLSFLTTAGALFTFSPSFDWGASSVMAMCTMLGLNVSAMFLAVIMLYCSVSGSFALLKTWTWDNAECTVPEDKELVRDMITQMFNDEGQAKGFEDGMDFFEKDLVQQNVRKAATVNVIMIASLLIFFGCSPMLMLSAIFFTAARAFNQ
mmetsp:Transcript_31523/g.57279  ORF Transcript_31523/g.57279 Transcript_31523/m.57279 type:complete len:500 (+) Transcript_31523:88-1587(+)